MQGRTAAMLRGTRAFLFGIPLNCIAIGYGMLAMRKVLLALGVVDPIPLPGDRELWAVLPSSLRHPRLRHRRRALGRGRHRLPPARPGAARRHARADSRCTRWAGSVRCGRGCRTPGAGKPCARAASGRRGAPLRHLPRLHRHPVVGVPRREAAGCSSSASPRERRAGCHRAARSSTSSTTCAHLALGPRRARRAARACPGLARPGNGVSPA